MSSEVQIIPTVDPPNGRGCGRRKAGRPYACVGLSEHGSPVESFVIDPAIPFPTGWQRGARILPRKSAEPDGLQDLVVFVGADSYPSPWDFVEETRRFGVSRAMTPNLPFDRLTPNESRMVFVHRKAIPLFPYETNRINPYFCCRFQYPAERWIELQVPGGHHEPIHESLCTHALRDLAFILHDEVQQFNDSAYDLPGSPAVPGFEVKLPSFSYTGRYPIYPKSDFQAFKEDWEVGIFLAMYLTHFEWKGEAPAKQKEEAQKAGWQTMEMEY